MREKHGCVRETSIGCLSHMPHPTGNLAHNPGMCPDWGSNWQPFTLWDDAQPAELGPKLVP